MYPMQSMPQLSFLSPQMLSSLMGSLELFTTQGMLEAAADVARILAQCLLPEPLVSSCHEGCPLNFPPPPFSSSRKRRRRRRRRRSQSPASTCSTSSSSLSTDVDAVVSSILELPVTSIVQAELNMEELIWDDAVFIAKNERQEEVAIVEEVINSVLKDVLSTSEGPVHVGAKEEMQLVDFSFAEDAEEAKSAAKDKEWLKVMLDTIAKHEAEYGAPHPLPYQGSDGFLHSADVKPPQVDFAALGFNSRRLSTPELYPLHGCIPSDEKFWETSSISRGAKPGLLTTGGVIQMPPELFGYSYVSGTGRDTVWAMVAHQSAKEDSCRPSLRPPTRRMPYPGGAL